MATPEHDWVWSQGADLDMSFKYLRGPEGSETAVNLTGYKLRMDIRATDITGTRVYTFNSDDIAGDTTIDLTGVADNEAVLSADGSIHIVVPRALTLPNGAIFAFMQDNISVFVYDIFLRDTAGKQWPILKGNISIEKSITLWA